MTKKDKIYISEFFVLIISLNESYGHNIFTKISQESLYDKLLMVEKKNNNVISRIKWEPITNYCVKFIMRSVTSTTFFAISSQQNLCEKLLLVLIWTQLKLFFY